MQQQHHYPQQQPAVMVITGNQWQDGICHCFNDGAICAQTAFCHICTASSIYFREQYKFPTSCDCGSCCLLWCFSGWSYYMCLPVNHGLTLYMNAGLRRSLIQRYGIQGESLCESCLLGLCCNVCTMCQVQRELKARGQHAGGLCAAPGPTVAVLPAAPPPQQQQMQYDPAAKPHQQQQQHHQQPVMAVPMHQQQMSADWASGICDCAGAPDCCEACWCGCCVIGHMGSKVNEIRGVDGAASGQLDPASCCGSVCAGGLYHFMLRRELVERYTISTESICQSALCVACCGPCTLAQSRREMGFRGEFPGGLCLKEMPPGLGAPATQAVQVR
jgi:Cys-rich protein (TIGR01571 family)